MLGGRYRLTRQIGTGASAYVYVAVDVTLRRWVAVKILHPRLADDEAFLRRFRAEACASAALHHPNILRVYDWGDDGGSPYLVTELLEGGNLRDLLDRGGLLTPAQAIAIGRDAADALAYAHRRNLVHRDIKPANVLFDEEGRVCIADFGMARAMAESTVTEPDGVIGTARYAAPEQVQGRNLGPRADVYSLALVLAEAITGRVPFAADTMLATLMGRVEAPIRVPGGIGPLAAVIEAAGSIDPDDRLDAAGMAQALGALARDLPPPAALALPGPPWPGQSAADGDQAQLEITAGADAQMEDFDPGGSGGPPQSRSHLDDPSPGGPWAMPAVTPDAVAYDDGETTAASELLTRERTIRPGENGASVPAAVRVGRTGSRRWWLAALAAVVALVAIGAAIEAWVPIDQPPPMASVPSLRGATEAQAAAILDHQRLVMTVAGRAYDATVAEGTVTAQVPATGRLRLHSPVAITLSLGPRPVPVPPGLAGLTRAQAISRIEAAGLRPGRLTSQTSATTATGRVIAASPATGELRPGTAVALVISAGLPQLPVPRLTPADVKSYAAAAAALSRAHLAPHRHLVFNAAAPGTVLGITPRAGSSVLYGTVVVVEVSKGYRHPGRHPGAK